MGPSGPKMGPTPLRDKIRFEFAESPFTRMDTGCPVFGSVTFGILPVTNSVYVKLRQKAR